MTEFAWRDGRYFQIGFKGNVMEQVQGMEPVIEGFTLGDGGDWAYNEAVDSTEANWSGGTGLSNATTYEVTWERQTAPE